MTDVEAAHGEVLAWIRDAPPGSPVLQPIPGVSDAELEHLARLAALLYVRLAEDSPSDLLEALKPGTSIQPSAAATAAFDKLIREDAVVNLANLYAAIVKSANRRPLGTFFTPRIAAQAIVESYAHRHGSPTEVVDVGAGVGIFSEVAHKQWPRAVVHAIDVNPLTLGLQAVATAGREEWNVNLEVADYRLWLESCAPTRPTLYLGNPPYTRWQLLQTATREDLLEAAGGLVGARANLSTLFLATTLRRLRPLDSLAMIIPAGWMRAHYGRKLRAHIRAQSHRQVSLRLADAWRFDQAIVDAVVVEVGPRATESQEIQVTDWSGSERVTVARADGESIFPAPGRAYLTPRPEITGSTKLSSIARVTRGTATGANRFFVRTADGWDALGIPANFRRPIARRLRPDGGVVPRVEVSELLVLGGYERGSDQRIDDLIDTAETERVNESYLCSKRTVWFDLTTELKSPDVIVSALAREAFHVLPNPGGLAITNNLFGLYWAPGVSLNAKEHVIDWLRSDEGQAGLRAGASLEANGLHRLSPKALGSLNLPAAAPKLPLQVGFPSAAVGRGRNV